VTRTRAALALAAVAALAVLALSGGSSSDPVTPPALPGLAPPFLTVAVLGDGGLTAGVDAYGDVVELRAPGPAGAALIDNPLARQSAGSVSAETGIVPRVSLVREAARPLWQADSVRQAYLPGTNVLRTTAAFGDGVAVEIECAASAGRLGCLSHSRAARGPRPQSAARVTVGFSRNLVSAAGRVHLDDGTARRNIAAATVEGRRWLAAAAPLGAAAPPWARRMYGRSLLVLRALTDARSGAVAAGARDGWAYVWPRDAGAVTIALAAAGYRGEARRSGRFLLGLDQAAAARFDGQGDPVPGRAAEGDAEGWVRAAARAAGLRTPPRPFAWRDRADYQEKGAGDFLGNALSAPPTPPVDGPYRPAGVALSAHRRGILGRVLGDPGSEADSAAAWAVRPFPRPTLFGAARRTLRRLFAGGGRFGIVPSRDWPGTDPWSAPTAWSAWSFAALGARHEALEALGDLRRAATPAGLLPERVDARSGVPRSTAPLAWSHAFAVLALRQLWPGTRQRESQ
jgi:hypothetical protein